MSDVDVDPAAVHATIREEVGRVLIGNDDVLEGITISMLTGGHVLLEGVPGVAKTTIANLVARATGLEYNRIQMTPDILPADITGTHVYREGTGAFELQKGPVFANMVVADEINRATPKTQSALLEAMEEANVTIEGETLPLPQPFTVIATQNPLEMEGTFSLPEAQRDRFQFKLTVDLPDRAMERQLLDRFDKDPTLGPETAGQVVDKATFLAAREAVEEVHVSEPVREYILDIVAATRDSPNVEHGGSPRATLAFLNAGKARAAIRGRDYVIPDDVKTLARPVLAHRLVLSTEAELGGESPVNIVDRLVNTVDAPSSVPSAESPQEADQKPAEHDSN
ncbi:MoxR family ATPase [Halorarum halophilum]|uniref:MoxR family ATPase n=1 Tax=Halorarum halophilum TaxID=2743090 RepID=A0A7D5K7E2_9EURY|nr:MoxR family ATPase [Halobaculum halophilum]QLG27439.1 MoxR family ATPase [Halobaculum halophilum]